MTTDKDTDLYRSAETLREIGARVNVNLTERRVDIELPDPKMLTPKVTKVIFDKFVDEHRLATQISERSHDRTVAGKVTRKGRRGRLGPGQSKLTSGQ
jgi:hypothetical protein